MPHLHIVDVSLVGILEYLTNKAWSKPCGDPQGSFVLLPSRLASDTSPQGLSRLLRGIYEHARAWAPGLDIPWFVPPVRVAALESEAGHFLVDEESYASIAVSTEFLGSIDATCLILAHEACHHILLQSGISYQFNINSRTMSFSTRESPTSRCLFVVLEKLFDVGTASPVAATVTT